ncbi:MAG TPA: NIPSNAP family protein [Puia sp.]|nr:NIPSNAP family protein [Puia sp.]
MKKYRQHSYCIFLFIACLSDLQKQAFCFAPPKQYYQLKIYQLKNKEQEIKVDQYLQNAFLPAIHRAGIQKAGVFKPLANDTAEIRQIFVFIPFNSIGEFLNLSRVLEKDEQYKTAGKDYFESGFKDPPYLRIESILLEAFDDMPEFSQPQLNSPAAQRIYELRSYEGATEKIHENKVEMFNKGGEIPLFKRLGFNAVFYAEVVSGSHMPNLMYLTTFENMTAHDQHWKAFSEDPEWKALSARPEYQNNVSKINIFLLHPTEYSDL